MILDKKHAMEQKLFRQFAETEFTKEILDELDETGEFNWDMHRKMAKYGFMGVKIPKEYGGAGGDYLSYALMVEELARGSAVLSIYANTSNSLGGGPLMLAGNEEQKKKYLPEGHFQLRLHLVTRLKILLLLLFPISSFLWLKMFL